MAAIDQAEMLECVKEIDKKYRIEQQTLAQVEQLTKSLQQLQKEFRQWRMDRETEQGKMLEAVTHMLKMQVDQHQKMEAVQKSLRQIQGQTLAKAQGSPPPAPVESLQDTAKRGAIAQLMVKTFGARGGHALAYNKTLAARMLSQQLLTAKEHEVWKKTGRIPDYTWEKLQAS